MKIDFKNGSTTKNLILLSIPVVIEQLLITLTQYVDTAMVGQLGENATASVSLTTTITWLINSISFAASIAVMTLIASSIGSQDRKKTVILSKQSLILTFIFGIAVGAISIGASPFIPVWMGAAEDIRYDASIYFAITSIPMLFRSATIILGDAIRATGDTKSTMYVVITQNIFNVGLNYLFIYVLGLGVLGAAVATAISHTFSGIAIFIIYRKKACLYYPMKELRYDKVTMRICWRLIYPVLLTHIATRMAHVVFSGLVSSGMGTTIFASHSIAITAEGLFYVGGFGIQIAVQTMVGMAVGERNYKKFEEVVRSGSLMVLIFMTVTGAIMYLISDPLASFFTISDEVAKLSAEMLRLIAFTEPLFGVMIIMQGIYYGLGQNRYPMIGEIISMWGVRVVFTYLVINVWHLGLREVWFCMMADIIFKMLFFTLPMLFKRSRESFFNRSFI